MKDSTPTLHILAGPNGSGKSTFSKEILLSQISSFDWDFRFDQVWKKFGYDPAVQEGVKDAINDQFDEEKSKSLNLLIDFAYETNFHSNKNFKLIQIFRNQGFEVIIYFLFIETIDKCKERVALRVSKGGHFVSDTEIENRYKEGLKNLKKSVSLNLPVFIYNMTDDRQQKPVLLFENGSVIQNNDCPRSLMKFLGI